MTDASSWPPAQRALGGQMNGEWLRLEIFSAGDIARTKATI
jgi:hypothetical protein